HEPTRVLGHQVETVGLGVIELLRTAMPAQVEHHDQATILSERLRPLVEQPVHRMGRGKAVNEHDRLITILFSGLENHIGYSDAFGEKLFHFESLLLCRYLSQKSGLASRQNGKIVTRAFP